MGSIWNEDPPESYTSDQPQGKRWPRDATKESLDFVNQANEAIKNLLEKVKILLRKHSSCQSPLPEVVAKIVKFENAVVVLKVAINQLKSGKVVLTQPRNVLDFVNTNKWQ